MTHDDPLVRAKAWTQLARRKEPDLPEAAALASCSGNAAAARIVLARGPLDGGFVFYTNSHSVKGRQLAKNPGASLCFHWKSIGRQLRLEGPTALVSGEEADYYFQRRPRLSQISAWASDQSRPCASRGDIEKRFAEARARFARKPVPRPDWWKGYRLTPLRMEFWQHRAHRLHDRVLYYRTSPKAGWKKTYLFP